jgi:uncharacterized protein YyaL (SSP411 family)
LSAWHSEHAQVVVAGTPADARALVHELARHYLPFAIVIPIEQGPNQDAVARLLPFTASMNPGAGRAAAYVCRNFTCRQPVTTVEALAGELDPASASRLELVKSLNDDDV